ncbi:phosphatase PAP2 family protein [candidate division KSB1 bacterium]|nr:phosphatase PAP2 family protein [candidate division KSB1 bacterium]
MSLVKISAGFQFAHLYSRLFFLGCFIASFLYCIITRQVPSSYMFILQLFLFALAFKRGKEFIKDWALFFVFFILYSQSRGLVFQLIKYTRLNIHTDTLLIWEKALFGEIIPTIWVQQYVADVPTVIDYFALFIYLSFFWLPMTFAFYLWIKNKEVFKRFLTAFALLSFMGLLTYLIFPAYPPWMASDFGLLPPLKRHLWNLNIGQWALSIFSGSNYNPIAPLPSLHAAWALLTSYFMAKVFYSRLGILSHFFYIYFILVSMTIIYSGDHYVVDILAGVLYTIIAVILTNPEIGKMRFMAKKRQTT